MDVSEFQDEDGYITPPHPHTSPPLTRHNQPTHAPFTPHTLTTHTPPLPTSELSDDGNVAMLAGEMADGTTEAMILLAAAHVEDARTGRGKYGRAQCYFKKKPAQV